MGCPLGAPPDCEPLEALEEALELARFELRYQILQQAAFKNLFAYRPPVEAAPGTSTQPSPCNIDILC